MLAGRLAGASGRQSSPVYILSYLFYFIYKIYHLFLVFLLKLLHLPLLPISECIFDLFFDAQQWFRAPGEPGSHSATTFAAAFKRPQNLKPVENLLSLLSKDLKTL